MARKSNKVTELQKKFNASSSSTNMLKDFVSSILAEGKAYEEVRPEWMNDEDFEYPVELNEDARYVLLKIIEKLSIIERENIYLRNEIFNRDN